MSLSLLRCTDSIASEFRSHHVFSPTHYAQFCIICFSCAILINTDFFLIGTCDSCVVQHFVDPDHHSLRQPPLWFSSLYIIITSVQLYTKSVLIPRCVLHAPTSILPLICVSVSLVACDQMKHRARRIFVSQMSLGSVASIG